MSEPQTILDYASPRKHGIARLPASSVLTYNLDERGGIKVTESLKGQAGAIRAIIFAAITIVYFGFVGVHATADVLRNVPVSRFMQQSYIMWPVLIWLVWLSELTVMVLVIDQTWRKTVLEAEADELKVTFHAIFRRREYRWPAEEIVEVRTVPTQLTDGASKLGELQIQPGKQVTVRLFTDHRLIDVTELAQLVLEALGKAERRERKQAREPDFIPSATMPPPPPPTETYDRLSKTKRSLDKRLGRPESD